MTLRIVAITAGLRQPSSSRLLADRLVAAAVARLTDAGEQTDVELVELREYARDLTNHLLTGFPSERLGALLQRLAEADALIAVSPIFTGSYSGLFKTFFDVLDVGAVTGKRVLIGATGGTARHALALDHALRPLFTYLRAVVVPTGVYAAPEDWGSDAALADRIDRAAAELVALVTDRPDVTNGPEMPQTTLPAPDGEADVLPFEQLLAATNASVTSPNNQLPNGSRSGRPEGRLLSR